MGATFTGGDVSDVVDIEAILARRTKVEAAAESGDPAAMAAAVAAESAGDKALRERAQGLREKADADGWSKQVREAGEFVGGVSKHLRAAAHLVEALLRAHGWTGLAAGAALYRRLVQERAKDLRPPLSPGGKRVDRHRPLLNLAQVPPKSDGALLGVWFVPMFQTPAGKAMRFRDLDAIEQSASAPLPADIEEPLTRWALDGAATWLAQAEAAAEEVAQLIAAIEADAAEDGNVPAEVSRLSTFQTEVLDYIDRVTKVVKARGGSAATAADAEGGAAASSPPAFTTASTPPATVRAAGDPRNRDEARRHIDAASRYFEAIDPHSPVSFRLRTAARWLMTPATIVLEEFIPKEHLEDVRRGMGLDPPAKSPEGESGGGGSGAPQPSSVGTESAAPPADETVQTPVRAPMPAEPAPPLPTPASRKEAVEHIASVRRYIESVEPHSLAKFPLALAEKDANVPLVAILDRAITSSEIRERLSRELGVPLKTS